MGNLSVLFTQWKDVENHLPAEVQQTAAPEELEGIHVPLIQGMLHGLASAAPSLYAAASGGNFLKIIGPPEALKGTLAHMVDKEGHILGGLVDESGRLVAQTRFEKAANTLNGTATAAATFQVLSVVTAQYYLHEISSSLKHIESKVDAIGAKMDDQQFGEISGAIETIDEIYGANVQHIENEGKMLWHPPEKKEFWTRIANVESALRKNINALESEIHRKLQEISCEVRDEDGRKQESFNEHREILKKLDEFYKARTVQNYLLALGGMMKWYQLTLAFKSQTLDGLQEGLYEAMIKFVQKRSAFFDQASEYISFIIDRPDGPSWKDHLMTGGMSALPNPSSLTSAFSAGVTLKDRLVAVGSGLVGSYPHIFLAGSVGRMIHNKRISNFERDREAALEIISPETIPFLKVAENFAIMVKSLDEKPEFYLEAKGSPDNFKLEIMRARH